VVEDVPVPGESVLVRALPAAFSLDASSSALKMVTGARGEQTATVDTRVMSLKQFEHGVIEPAFNADETKKIAEKYGPAFNKVVAKIDELSGVDKEAIDSANERFQAGVEGPGHDGEAEPASASTNGERSAVRSGAGA
jgi:hypothetical protein